jgi:hypothetical protein
MTSLALQLALAGETATAREACEVDTAPNWAPKASREPPSPTPFAPQRPLEAAPAMSVAAARSCKTAKDGR